MCQHKTNVHKLSGAPSHRLDATDAEGPGRLVAPTPPARHRRDTSTPSTRHGKKRTGACAGRRDEKTECLSHRYGTSCTKKRLCL